MWPGATHRCTRPDEAARRRLTAMLARIRPGPELYPPRPDDRNFSEQDLGCVGRGGAYLARVRSLAARTPSEAAVLVQGGRLRVLAGWSGSAVSFSQWIDVDLDGDGAPESLLRWDRSPDRHGWIALSTSGVMAAATVNFYTAAPLRVRAAPEGNAFILDAEQGPLRAQGTRFVPATGAAFAAVRDATRRLFTAQEHAADVALDLDASLLPPQGSSLDAPAPRGSAPRVAWERALTARLRALGVPEARATELVAAVPAPQ